MKKALLSLIIVCLSFFSCEGQQEISVDFMQKQNATSMVGFLHFNDIFNLRNDILELQPVYWRFRWQDDSPAAVDFLIANKVTPIIVTSDRYGYPDNLGAKWKSPLRSTQYMDIIKGIYNKLGNKVIYDIWNEPYMKGFGGFTSQDFFMLFKQAHDQIRSLPNGEQAQIAGPSFEHFDRVEILNFLQFCKSNNIRLDVFAWHDWRNDKDLPALKEDIAWLKNVAIPKYPSLGIKKIVLTEAVHAYIQFSPAQIYKVYKALEEAGIDGACRGCFAESESVVNCENNSITGLLTPDGKRRAAWWATKFYTECTHGRVRSKSNSENLISFASLDKYGANILLANNDDLAQDKIVYRLLNLNMVQTFKKTKLFKLKIYRLPATGKTASRGPSLIMEESIPASQNTALVLPKILPQEVFKIVLRP